MKLVHGQKAKILVPSGQMLIVDIYPVGLLAEIQNSWRTRSNKIRFTSIWGFIRDHEWRHLKNHFNGYLAKPDLFPGRLTRCGSGWTRQRALRDLRRRVRKYC